MPWKNEAVADLVTFQSGWPQTPSECEQCHVDSSDPQHAVPCDVARRRRLLTKVRRWKASEFRQFLLHIGPVVFQDIRDPCKYDNFLEPFMCAPSLCHPSLHLPYFDFIPRLLIVFIKNFVRHNEPGHLVYNGHCLIQLLNDVRAHGTPVEFSSVSLESCMRF
ncbi:putative PrC protein [Paragonimus heterotremus]|uniref:Putative PrC protein n=1 Tax=Paragonimus heterotremus TaxID=100268 RepID=A0A8J4T656_9TREM|nr:putative PrC protein [Paragonimus heterotremus]